MSRTVLFGLSILAGLAAGMGAQDRVITTRVFTQPEGLRFFVDGVSYKGSQAFQWPEGSKHTLFADTEQAPFPGTRQKFEGWSDSSGSQPFSGETITVTANAATTWIKATFTLEHLVRINISGCTSTVPGECRPPGTVYVGGGAQTSDYQQWLKSGETLVMTAAPNPGFVFSNWGPLSNFSTNPTYRHIVTGSVTFANPFAPAKRVILLSEPEDLLLAPDRTPTRSPAELDWGMGTRHVLGAVTPQTERQDGNRYWVFAGWSNGMGFNDVYTVPNDLTPVTITGRFVRGAGASFVTNPVGLKLRIDGRDNWPAYNFIWGVGMKYPISAPAEQVDSRGRRYVFKGWSNGGPAAQEITIQPGHVDSGFRLIASYEAQSRLNITTNPPGLPIAVDGVECRSECVYDRLPGAQVRITAPASISMSDSSRMDFTGWSDGVTATRTYTFDERPQTSLLASYSNYYRLVTLAEPGDGASLRVEPQSADGFYESGVNVVVAAEDRPGFQFKRWEGDLTGSFRMGSVNMTVPRVVRALLDRVPYVHPSGVRNAAGETLDNVVAPGSIASIFGVNLAGEYQAGPLSPLSQTIGDVTVRLANRFMPLLFVSSEQVNFIVPSDLTEGAYTLGVKWGSNTEVTASMRVARNAPGLFGKAFRENGDEIKEGSPARRGDVVTLFGTGFGPYDRAVIDGFPLPAQPAYNLLDPVEVLTGDRVLETVSSGGVAGQIGTAAVRFRLPEDIAVTGGELPVRVRVNGRESNGILIRIE